MNGHIKKITTYAAVLLLIVQTLMASVCFAEEDDFIHVALRDDTMFMEIPKTWQVEEIGSFDEDVELAEDGMYVYEVAELKDQEDAKRGELWFCADPYDGSYYYCDSEQDAEDYLNQSGNDAVDSVMDEAFPDAGSWVIENPTYLKGEDAFTYVIRQNAEVDGTKYLVYLAAEFTSNGGVHEVLLFEEPYDQNVCDRIGESPEGYSYASELIDNKLDTGGGGNQNDDSGFPDYYFDNDNSFADMFRTLSAGIVTIIVFALIFKVLKSAANTGGQRKKAKPSFENAVMGQAADRRKEKRPAHKTIDKWTLREFRKGECDHEDMHIESGTKYSGYHESLKTLHRSGLLTTKEMNELLDKHKNDL